MAMTRRTKAPEPEKPRWTWGFNEYDSAGDVEQAILDAILDHVLDGEDLADPQERLYDVEVTVHLVPRGEEEG